MITRTLPDFDPDQIFTSGQTFRFKKLPDGCWSGVYKDRPLTLKTTGDETAFSDFDDDIVRYLDLDFDYGALKKIYQSDETLSRAASACGGIRILRQDPFEALISFIISQNNNIKRISKIIENIASKFGRPVGNGLFAFPEPLTLASAAESDFAALGAGYRANYIKEAAEAVSSGAFDLNAIFSLDYETAKARLMCLKGIGAKVADCVLLFGFAKKEAFPVDVWMKKVLSNYYPEGFPERFYDYRGVAQQYLFQYIRVLENKV